VQDGVSRCNCSSSRCLHILLFDASRRLILHMIMAGLACCSHLPPLVAPRGGLLAKLSLIAEPGTCKQDGCEGAQL